jgi:2-methylcitrate dehydratase PrpD
VDSFIHIIEENDLLPEDIEKVRVTEWEWGTTASFPFCNENQLETKEDVCFNIAYLLACAAYKHHPTRWFDSEVFQDPKIREFMQRVDKIKEPDQRLLGIEVVTKDGKNFMTGGGCTGGVCEIEPKEKVIRGGLEFPEEETKEELVDKFINNASRTLSSHKSNEIVQTVLELEKLENVARLMQIIIP